MLSDRCGLEEEEESAVVVMIYLSPERSERGVEWKGRGEEGATVRAVGRVWTPAADSVARLCSSSLSLPTLALPPFAVTKLPSTLLLPSHVWCA